MFMHIWVKSKDIETTAYVLCAQNDANVYNKHSINTYKL